MTIDDIKAVARAIRHSLYPAQDIFIELFARLAFRKNLIRLQLPAADPQRDSKSVAIYVHFDKDGEVFDYVIHQLKQLVDAGFRITFVSNSPKFPDASRERLTPYCRSIVWRFNTGYDFGAYKDGIASVPDLAELETLVLMNDSVYGPFRALTETLNDIDRSTTDFWGIVDSWEYRHHLQTFFLVFFSPVLKSSTFRKFWKDLPYVNQKKWVVRNGEVRLSQVLEKAGFHYGVLASCRAVAQSMKSRMFFIREEYSSDAESTNLTRYRTRITSDRPINPMQYYWDVLISDYRCPFIKRDLLRSNPANIPFVDQWSAVIAAHSDYDISLIERHLKP